MTEERLDNRRYDAPPSWVAAMHAQSEGDPPPDIDGESDSTSGGVMDKGYLPPRGGGDSASRDEGFPTHYSEEPGGTSTTGEGDPPPLGDEGFGGH